MAATTVTETPYDESDVDAPPLSGTREAILARLLPVIPGSRLIGWVAPLAVTVLAAVLRFWGLGSPGSIIFDETYYAQDAYNLLHHGVELNNEATGPGYVVHPPLGKWMIAVGEWMFGTTRTPTGNTQHPWAYHGAFGWRFSAAVIGSLAVLLLARTVRRMTRSTLLGCTAGLLLTLDGLEFVDSRAALLDIFLMFWALAGFACLVRDRDDVRERLARAVERAGTDAKGRLVIPSAGPRWWLLGAAVCTALACAVKWSGIWFIPAYLLLALAWEVGARRTAGARAWSPAVTDALAWLVAIGAGAYLVKKNWHHWYVGLAVTLAVAVAWEVAVRLIYDESVRAHRWRGAGWRPVLYFTVVPVVVYTATWTGWFLAGPKYAYAYDRYERVHQGWLARHLAVVRGWISYQIEALHFHNGLDSGHPYASRPLDWLVLRRPVAYFYEGPKLGQSGCHVASCSREILAIGTPLIWWASIFALLVALWLWISRRDWRASGTLVGFAAAYLTWLPFAAYLPGTGTCVHGVCKPRTMFLFYALPALPFMIMAITLTLGLVLGRQREPSTRRMWGSLAGGLFVLFTIVMFFYFWPILTGQTIPYSQWQDRMWFSSWI